MDEITKEGQKEKVITKWAVGYCRESKEKADIKEARDIKAKDFLTTSIKYQKEGAQEQSQIDSLKLAEIFVDVNIQSTTTKRPDFEMMLKFIDEHLDKIKKVYIKNYSRLGRYMAFFKLRNQLINHGISKQNILFYNEPHSNRINSEDDSIIMIKVGAEYVAIEKNRKEYYKMQERKQKHNIPYISPPFGYKWSKDKGWKIDNKKAEKINQIFELTKQGKNYKEIAKEFKISQRLYYKIVRNKTYTGVVCHKQKIKDDEGRVLRVEQIEYKGKHQPIISLELFEEVQKIINKRMWVKQT